MRLEELLEQDKEELLTRIRQAVTPERVVPVLEKEVDRILVRYNEECESKACRQTAAQLLQIAQIGCGLVDSIAEIRMWERSLPTKQEQTAVSRRPVIWTAILLTAGLICLGVGGVLFFSQQAIEHLQQIPLMEVMFTGGVVALFFGAFLLGRQRKETPGKEHLTENRVDEERCYRLLHAMCLAADQNLQETTAQEEWEKRTAELADGESTALPEKELLLLSDLLEAESSKDGAYALEKLSEIKYYLHQNEIDVVDYEPDTERLFDRIPSKRFGVIRPALMRKGEVIRRGLVQAPEEV